MGAAQPELKYSEAPLVLALSPSRIGAIGLASMVAASLVVIGFTPGSTALRVLAATWIACGGLEALHAIALHRGRRGARVLRVSRGGAIEVTSGAGGLRSGELCRGSFVAPWLTIVRWRPRAARFDRTILILPDMLAREDFRRLRVLLRWS
jgi:toxin CptA